MESGGVLFFLIAVIYTISVVFFIAIMTKRIAEEKGHYDGFLLWGFLFQLVALWVAIGLPDRNLPGDRKGVSRKTEEVPVNKENHFIA